jgi:hypothetical protein
MHESSFDAMRSAWLRDAADPEALQKRAAAHRRRIARDMRINAAGSVVVAAMFATFAWFAVRQHDAMFAVAALAFLAGLPLLIAGYLQTRRATLGQDRHPSGHLETLRAWTKIELATLTSAIGCAAILGVAEAVAIITAVLGLTPITTTIWPALAWTATAIAVWIWQARRRTQLSLEAENLDRLIEQFRRADAA